MLFPNFTSVYFLNSFVILKPCEKSNNATKIGIITIAFTFCENIFKNKKGEAKPPPCTTLADVQTSLAFYVSVIHGTKIHYLYISFSPVGENDS